MRRLSLAVVLALLLASGAVFAGGIYNGGSGGSGSGTVSTGTAGQYAYYGSNGTTVIGTAAPSASAAGSTNQIQYNSSGNLAANSSFVYSGGNLGIGTATPRVSLDDSANTDAFAIPVGTAGARSSSPFLGEIRLNSSIADAEIYIGSTSATGGWGAVSTGGSLDPTGFNAKCDGTTNDVSALNTAISYPSNPGSVLLPANKICGISNTVTLSAANQLWNGQGSTLKILSGSNSGMDITANAVTVANQYLNGNSSGATGILVQGEYDLVGYSNLQNTASHGIDVDGQSSTCGYNRITNNTVGGSGAVGMGANDCQHVAFTGNLVYNSTDEGTNLDNLSHYGRILNFDLISNSGGTGGIGISNSNYIDIGDGSILNQGASLPAISVNNQGGTSYGGMIHDVAMTGDTGCVLLGTSGSYYSQNFIVHGTSCDGTGYAVTIGTSSSNNLYYGNNTGGGAIVDNGTHDIIYGNTGTGTYSFNVNVGATFGASYLNTAAPANGLLVQGNVGIGPTALGSYINLAVNGGLEVGSYAGTATAGLSNGILTSGNVAIGTSVLFSSPSGATLQLGKTAIAENVVGSQALFANNAYFNGTNWVYATTAAAGGLYNDGNLKFFNAPSGTAGSTITNFAGSDIGILVTNNSPPLIAIGTSSVGAGRITLGGLSTGTNADFLCLASDNSVLIQSSACTISQRKLKEHFAPLSDDAVVADLMALKPQQFNFRLTKPTNPDPNATATQYGFVAEEVASVDPKISIFENDMATPKSYRQESIIALLDRGFQIHQKEIEALQGKRLLVEGHKCFFNLLVCAD